MMVVSSSRHDVADALLAMANIIMGITRRCLSVQPRYVYPGANAGKSSSALEPASAQTHLGSTGALR